MRAGGRTLLGPDVLLIPTSFSLFVLIIWVAATDLRKSETKCRVSFLHNFVCVGAHRVLTQKQRRSIKRKRHNT